MVKPHQTEKITEICRTIPEVKLAYLFGSQATGRTGVLSDYDFAFYLDESISRETMFDLKLNLHCR